MAESRIIKYDTVNKTVHWFYHRHEDDKRIDVTEPVENFIKKVIRHCPEANFKMVRYYGFYSNKGIDKYNKMAELLGKKQRRELLNKEQRRSIVKIKTEKTYFRYSIMETFQRDPLLCHCGQIMIYLESHNLWEGGVKNDRRYRDQCILENKYLNKKKSKQ